jgi:hypothetical protein
MYKSMRGRIVLTISFAQLRHNLKQILFSPISITTSSIFVWH